MIILYHKPTCSTSRRVLQVIRDAGYQPQVIDYIKTGWTRPILLTLFTAAEVSPRQALRTKEPSAKALLGADDDAILDAMIADPVLVERPFVRASAGTRLCRPVERVFEIL